jgi:hypothetical protein
MRESAQTWEMDEGLGPVHHKKEYVMKCDTVTWSWTDIFVRIYAMENGHEIWNWGSQWSLETGLF